MNRIAQYTAVFTLLLYKYVFYSSHSIVEIQLLLYRYFYRYFVGILPETRYFLLAFYRYFRETLDSVIFLTPCWQPWTAGSNMATGQPGQPSPLGSLLSSLGGQPQPAGGSLLSTSPLPSTTSTEVAHPPISPFLLGAGRLLLQNWQPIMQVRSSIV